jgi:nucleoside-diphosphate-sugar epimerase
MFEKGATMKVFVAGATGAIGRPLVDQFVRRGHEVVASTRTPAKADTLRAAGAEPVVLDVLDRDAVMAAVMRAEPDAVIHQATALGAMNDFRHIEREFAQTNRLRTEGTDHLLEAARAAGAGRFVAQSFAGWPAARRGGWVKTEEDPFDDHPPAQMRSILAAIMRLEAVVTQAEGIAGVALRYGGFYGPGTGLAPGGSQWAEVRKRRFPIVGEGRGVWSFIHIEDAAEATVLAAEQGARGVYNIVDDDPAPVAAWLPALAEAVGAKPPRRVPVWLGRLLAGDHAVSMMNEIRGASNAKARAQLGWAPRTPSWRVGFPALAGAPSLAAA